MFVFAARRCAFMAVDASCLCHCRDIIPIFQDSLFDVAGKAAYNRAPF
jgi:hypothetical protein